jgi:hypothetical protein
MSILTFAIRSTNEGTRMKYLLLTYADEQAYRQSGFVSAAAHDEFGT